MQVINRFRLRDFWLERSRSEHDLRGWVQLISSYDWSSLEELRTTFPNLHEHLNLVAFDLQGGTYFVITSIDYHRGRVWVRDVQLHTEFRTESWKTLATEEPAESKSYDALLNTFPLRPIGDDEQLHQASALLDKLVAIQERSRDEQDYLDVLSLLVQEYEQREVSIPPVSAAHVLRMLVTEHRLSLIDLIPLLGGKQKAMALLQGTRPLDLRQATRAARYFKLPAETFVDPDDLEIELPKPSR